jgi:transcriptional regulator NrdR family protein
VKKIEEITEEIEEEIRKRQNKEIKSRHIADKHNAALDDTKQTESG